MQQGAPIQGAAQDARNVKWDAFLDAYSVYLTTPSTSNAASLKLAATELEAEDSKFSLEEFEYRLGWRVREEVEC